MGAVPSVLGGLSLATGEVAVVGVTEVLLAGDGASCDYSSISYSQVK